MKRGVLCALLLLAAASSAAWAQPEIVWYRIQHGAAQCDFPQKICVGVRPSSDEASGLAVEVRPPGSDAYQPVAQCQGWDEATQTMAYRQAVTCQNSTMPAVGAYALRATDSGGQATLTTDATTTFPTEPVHVTYPAPYQVVDSTNPVVTWEPYSFPGDPLGTPGAVVQRINPQVTHQNGDGGPPPGVDNVDLARWAYWLYERFWALDCIVLPESATATSWEYNGGTCGSADELTPGRVYAVNVALVSTGHAMGDTGWYNEIARSDTVPFAVGGAAPAFEELRLARGVTAYPNGRRAYGEWAIVLGADINGVENLQVEVSDPNKVFREQKGTLVAFYGDGVFTQGPVWAEGRLGDPLQAGTYAFTLTDRASGAQATLTYEAEALPAPPAITAPKNNAVLGQTPSFTWRQPPDQCATMVWIEELPPGLRGYDFVHIPFAQVLPSYADGRIVWSTCLPGDATEVTYGSDGEALQPGRTYRLHVMTEVHDCRCPRRGEGVLQAWSNLRALVDFTVR